MTWFYVRWLGLFILSMVFVFLVDQRYTHTLKTIPLKTVRTQPASQTPVRVMGMVSSGSLQGNLGEGQAAFELVDGADTLAVLYNGLPPENLRELKTVVMIGQWDPAAQVFHAHEMGLVPHFGFVVSAYAVAFLPIMVIIFFMGRKVMLLFQEIKQSKLYEPEAPSHVDNG